MTRRALLILLAISLLAYIGCGGGAGNQTGLSGPATNRSSPVNQAEEQPQALIRNVLSTELPVLTGRQSGFEFELTVKAQFADALYQGSGRIIYDSAVVQPVSARRGAAVPPSSICSVKLDATAMISGTGNTGIVPFAFTGLPGSQGCGQCDGELLRVRFRLIGSVGAQQPVYLLNDSEYLQVRGLDGQRLSFDLSTKVVSQ